MTLTALQLYDEAMRAGQVLQLSWRATRAPGNASVPAGWPVTVLDVPRWCADADAVDRALLDRCDGPTLDVGCGPGRLVAALSERGVPVLGVDIAPHAVALTQRSGGLALRRTVFEQLPGEGRWSHVLLADGNIGIGGNPAALLDRVAELLRPGGLLHVEVEPATAAEEVDQLGVVVVQDALGRTSAPFRWARLGAAALTGRARAAGYYPVDDWSARESGVTRRFVVLRR